MLRDFYRWNRCNSKEHFDDFGDWEVGADTYFNVSSDKSSFYFCTYSSEEKAYDVSHEGVKLVFEKRTYECDVDFESSYQIDLEWKIVSDTGHMSIEIDGKRVSVEWEGGEIRDLYGNVADLFKVRDLYVVKERLTERERKDFIILKRFNRLKAMDLDDETRSLIINSLMELGEGF